MIKINLFRLAGIACIGAVLPVWAGSVDQSQTNLLVTKDVTGAETPTMIAVVLACLVLGLFIYVAMAPRQQRAQKLRFILFLLSLVPGRGAPRGFRGKGGRFGGGGSGGRF